MSALNIDLPTGGILSSIGNSTTMRVDPTEGRVDPTASAFEKFMEKTMADQNGRYLGAAFTPPSPTTPTNAPKVQGNNFSLEMPESAVPFQNAANPKTATTTPTQETKTKLPMGTIMGEAASGLSSMAQANDNLSRNEYNDDLTYWENQGKDWFDPKQVLKPNLEDHLNQMPSSTEALAKNAFGGEVMNPAGWQFKNSEAATYALNPLKALDKIGGEGFAKYVSSSGVKRGIAGVKGGPLGIAAGAIVGVVEGLFTWGAAKDEDAKNKENARIEFEKKLKEWTISKNRRLVEQNVNKYTDMQNKKATSKAQDKADKAEKNRVRSEKRNALASVLSNAGKMKSSYTTKRLERWEK